LSGRDRQDVFSGVFAWSGDRFDLAQGGAVHDVNGLWVSGDFFKTLELRPAAGRLIAASDDQRGCAGAVVLSDGFWQEHYGGAPSAIGSTLALSTHPFEVVGVAPAASTVWTWAETSMWPSPSVPPRYSMAKNPGLIVAPTGG
jgi:putative ABC transport system permease protein